MDPSAEESTLPPAPHVASHHRYSRRHRHRRRRFALYRPQPPCFGSKRRRYLHYLLFSRCYIYLNYTCWSYIGQSPLPRHSPASCRPPATMIHYLENLNLMLLIGTDCCGCYYI